MRSAGLVTLGAVLVALLLPSAGNGVLTTASPAPSYMSGLGTRFEMPSNGRFANAEEVTKYNSNNPLNKPFGQDEKYASIWTEKCNPRQDQTAKFRRTIDIPGPPSTARFKMVSDFGSFSNPLKRYVLEINDEKMSAGPVPPVSDIEVTLPEKKLKGLRDGPNRVEVTVKRSELPEHVRKCNTKKKNRVGVLFVLGGEFTADLGLIEPAPPPQTYYRASTSRTVIVNLRVYNRGPSALVPGAGQLFVDVGGATQIAVAGSQGDPRNPQVVPTGPPFDNCVLTGARVECALGHMSSGDRGVLSIYIQKKFQNTDFNESYTSVSWRTGSSVTDPKLDNNSRSNQIVWCGDDATSPGCASAQ